jgi:hypothetical protein
MIDQSLLQVKENIRGNVKIAESIAKTITFDKKYNDFLSSEFKGTGQDLVDFNNTIMPFLRTISSLNPSFYSIWVYTANETIPSSWENSYGMDNISKYRRTGKKLEAEKRFYCGKSPHQLPGSTPIVLYRESGRCKVFFIHYKIYSQYARKLVELSNTDKSVRYLKPLESTWMKISGEILWVDRENCHISTDREAVIRNIATSRTKKTLPENQNRSNGGNWRQREY